MSVEDDFVGELGRVNRKWRARLDERLRHTGLTQARWLALFQISRRDGAKLTQRELAEILGIEGPTLVRILDGLEGQGLIERCPVANDRRAKTVQLTEAAKPLIVEIERIAGDLRRELLGRFGRDELQSAARILRDIGDRLER